jgi:hypothetical protein
MIKKYKLKYHLRQYIKQELYDFNRNKQILKDIQKNIQSLECSNTVNSKTLLILQKKIIAIEKVYQSLNEDEKKLFNIIFEKGCNQLYAKTYYNITKDMYYNAMNKIIYLTAKEYEQI